MTRILPLLILGCLAAIGFTAYSMLYGGGTDHIRVPVPKVVPAAEGPASEGPASKGTNPGDGAGGSGTANATATSGDDDTGAATNNATGAAEIAPSGASDPLATAVTKARRSHSANTAGKIVEQLQRHLKDRPEDRDGWRHLAAALLQKVVQRGHLLGMRPGRPVYSELPAEIAADLDAAQSALAKAGQLGDDSAEHHRLAAEIMSQRITGLSTALEWNGKIEAAITAAGERNADDPQLHLVLGVRKLMAPRFFGQDIAAALEHFHYVASARPDDERPAIFAAMAFYLTKKRLAAIEWLEKAVARNPHNLFAKVVLKRLRRGEKDPFGRNVTATEAAANKDK
ncbi:MAG: hypothetical protein NXI31_14070 [bacterium]|nr:hypothetical protein [bacterium]